MMQCKFVVLSIICLTNCVHGVEFNVRGLVPSVFTPFNEAGQLNTSVIFDYAKYLKDNDVDGALVGGTASEGPGLGLKERMALLDVWIEAARPLGLKVVMQIGGMPMPEVLELARYSETVRPDALLTLPELYYKPGNIDTLVRYVKLISEAAPSLPILYYDHPSLSGVNLNMPKFFSLASKSIPNFMGIKCGLMTAVNIEANNDISEEKGIFMAHHAIRGPASMMGFNSSMSAISNIFPHLMRDIARAVRVDDLRQARYLQEDLNKKVAQIVSYNEYVPSVKAAMEMISGLSLGNPRDPLTPLTKEQKNRLFENINQMHL